MSITKVPFDQFKIDRLKNFLTANAEKGNPKFFEIFVDSLKVVPKTTDPADFESYEDYISEDTEKVKILIYNSGNSPRNDQHIFLMKDEPKGLNGIESIDEKIKERIDSERKNWETDLIKRENTDLKQKLKDAEDYIDLLQDEVEEVKKNKFKLGNMNVGELASVMVEGMIRRNPQMLTKIPGGQGLAGIIEEDNREKEKQLKQPQIQSEASFESVPEISDEDQQYLNFIRSMQERFNETQMQQVMEILQRLSTDTSKIQQTLNQLKQTQNQSEHEL